MQSQDNPPLASSVWNNVVGQKPFRELLQALQITESAAGEPPSVSLVDTAQGVLKELKQQINALSNSGGSPWSRASIFSDS